MVQPTKKAKTTALWDAFGAQEQLRPEQIQQFKQYAQLMQ